MFNKLISDQACNYLRLKEEVISNYPPTCKCNNTGLNSACLNCPYYEEIVNKIQSLMFQDPETECITYHKECPDHNLLYRPHPEDFVKECLDYLQSGKSLSQTSKDKGVPKSTLKKWKNKYDLCGISNHEKYSNNFKKQCLQSVQEIGIHPTSQKFDLSVNTLKGWITKSNQGRLFLPSKPYKSKKTILNKETEEEITTLFTQGKNITQISSHVKIRWSIVKEYLKSKGFDTSLHHSAKKKDDKADAT